MNDQDLDAAVEVIHLRRLLDIQPSCLMRLGREGVLLAANDAALTLLGVESGLQALGRSLANWIPPEQRDGWAAFADRVSGGAPASFECDVIDASGGRHATVFHGVPLEHPDGLPSIAVSARAVSGRRQLEAAVLEREELLRTLEAERQDARERLAAMQQQLAEAAAERRADRQRYRDLLESLAAEHRQELLAARHELDRTREAHRKLKRTTAFGLDPGILAITSGAEACPEGLPR